jgi:hypothetical protein
MFFFVNAHVVTFAEGDFVNNEFSLRFTQPKECRLTKSDVGVEKGTKAVISANSSACRERTLNNLRANFVVEIP